MIKETKDKKKIKKKKVKQIKKKIQRSKKMKNAQRNFTIVYQNIRGLKSKIDSVQELVDDCQPNLLCLVETHMQEEEGYEGMETIYRGRIMTQCQRHNENNNHASKTRNRSRADIMDTTK